MFWIRLTLTTAIMGFAAMSKLVTLVPDLNPTFSRRQLVTWGASAAYVGTALPAAIVIGFPVPLMWYLGGFFVGIHVQAMLLLVFGREPFMKTSACRPNLQRFVRRLAASLTLANIYPLYKVLYGFVPVQNRGIVAVLICRFGSFVLNILSALSFPYASHHNINVSLDAFHAADIGQSLLEFWDIRVNANTVLRLLRDRHASSQRLKMSKSERFSRTPSTSNLVAWILAVTRDPTAAYVWSLLPSSDVSKTSTDVAGAEVSIVYRDASSQPPRLLPRAIRVAKAAIFPEHSNQVAVFTAETEATARAIKEKTVPTTIRLTASDTLELPQKDPKAYSCFIANTYVGRVRRVYCAAYFRGVPVSTQTATECGVLPWRGDNWETGAMTNILVFAALEIASLLLLHFFLQCKFSFSPLYQLAFVLETQVYWFKQTSLSEPCSCCSTNSSITVSKKPLAKLGMCMRLTDTLLLQALILRFNSSGSTIRVHRVVVTSLTEVLM
ncbi:hypothetical protein GQ600_8134 [Phytophthora cactorum]|nr:hypothetical protein GQ600_8134 [Phytophthora cactorum]